MLQSRLTTLVLLLSFSIVSAEDLRLNAVEDSVVIPSGLNDYAVIQKDSSLFVAWIDQESSRGIVLTEVDLQSFEVTELFKEVASSGTPSSPALSFHEDELNLAWFLKEGRGSRIRYKIELLSGLGSGHGQVRDSVAYGYQPRGFVLQSTPLGLFVGGATVSARREPMRLSFYRKAPEGWVSSEIPGSLGAYDQRPSLGSAGETVQLAWVRDGKVNVARTVDGENWDRLQALSGDGAEELSLLVRDDQESSVVWVEKTAGREVRVRMASSSDGGASWWHASQNLVLNGSRVEFDFIIHRDSRKLLVYHYWSPEESCEMIESCILSPDWRRYRLDDFPDRVCGRSLNPVVLLGQNRLYVAWQERRGRNTSLALNSAEYPWREWLAAPVEIVSSENKQALAGPKLVALEDRLFMTFFAYSPKKGPFQKNLQLGNLLLRELDGKNLVLDQVQ